VQQGKMSVLLLTLLSHSLYFSLRILRFVISYHMDNAA